MKEWKCVPNVPFDFNIRRGFTWLRPLPSTTSHSLELEPEPAAKEPAPQTDQLIWSQEDVVTTCEEAIAYKVVDRAVSYLLPGNFYKVGDFIYSWDNWQQQWVCIDQIESFRDSQNLEDEVDWIKELF